MLGWILIPDPTTRRIIKIRMGVFVSNWARNRANVLLTTKNVLKIVFPFSDPFTVKNTFSLLVMLRIYKNLAYIPKFEFS